jgi:hypothetical protein
VLGLCVAARYPDDVLDLLFTVAAKVISEASPVKSCETAPEVASDPIFARLNFSTADIAGVNFQV